MDLISETRPATVWLHGQEHVSLVADQRFKIKVDDVDLLNEKVPNNKTWTVTVTVNIDQS